MMGQIADDMLCGLQCSGCGCIFQDPAKPNHAYTHGHPVLCHSCWDDWTDAERADFQRARVGVFGDMDDEEDQT